MILAFSTITISLFSFFLFKFLNKKEKGLKKIKFFIFLLFSILSHLIIYLLFQNEIFTFFLGFVFSLYFLVILFDFAYFIIPDTINFLLLVLALIIFYFFPNYVLIPKLEKILALIFVLIVFLIVLLLDKVFKKEILGYGDIKLLISTALLLGLNLLFRALFLASFTALIVEVIILKKKRKILPFGPYLVIGFMLSIILSSI